MSLVKYVLPVFLGLGACVSQQPTKYAAPIALRDVHLVNYSPSQEKVVARRVCDRYGCSEWEYLIALENQEKKAQLPPPRRIYNGPITTSLPRQPVEKAIHLDTGLEDDEECKDGTCRVPGK